MHIDTDLVWSGRVRPLCCYPSSHIHLRQKGSIHSSEGVARTPRSHAAIHLVERRNPPYTHKPSFVRVCVCGSGLLSLQCSHDWVSPLNWLHFWTIPLSRVRDRLVGPALLQRNWPFKEGLHHVKPCNWERYSLCSICFFVRLFSDSSPQQLLSTGVWLNSWRFLPMTPGEP